jgi:hypothetical protein
MNHAKNIIRPWDSVLVNAANGKKRRHAWLRTGNLIKVKDIHKAGTNARGSIITNTVLIEENTCQRRIAADNQTKNTLIMHHDPSKKLEWCQENVLVFMN